MSTQLSVHTKEVPSFTLSHFSTFSTLTVTIRKTEQEGSVATEFTMFLPTGTTHGDIMKSLADASVEKYDK